MNGFDHGRPVRGGAPSGEVTPPIAPPAGSAETELQAAAGAPDVSTAPEFEQVYVEHFDFACRSLQLLGVSPDALEDAAQDVFGVVLRKLAEFAGNSSMKTWIFAIVQRVAANYRRASRRKVRPLLPLLELPASDEPSPEAFAEAAQAAARIRAFCERLDESRRAVFVLALVEDVPAREIAPALGIPLFTVYSRVRSLREALRLFLETHEASP